MTPEDGFDGFQLPAPIDWQKFERLCCDLWRRIWRDDNAQLNGRSGQAQNGVDVWGNRNGEAGFSGVQCRRKGNQTDSSEVSEEELRAEVNKAEDFQPRLTGEFVLAYTGPRDAKIQEVARRINEERSAASSFKVVVCSWQDIQDYLGSHPEVFLKHYPGIVTAVRRLDQRVSPQLVAAPAPVAQVSTQVLPVSPIQGELTGVLDVLQSEYRAEIQGIRALLKSGHPTAAIEQAEALKTRIWAAASSSTRARLLILIGHARLEAGDESAAARSLIDAGSEAPDDPDVHAEIALGHSLQSNDEAALAWSEKALARNPLNIVAVQVSALHDRHSDEEVLARHEAAVGKRVELYSILGHRCVRRGDVDAARAWFEKASEMPDVTPESFAALGQVIVDMVARDTARGTWLSRSARTDLKRGVDYLQSAIGSLKDPQARAARLGWYMSRALGKRMLQAEDVALCADEALAIQPSRPEAIRIRAAVAFENDDSAKAIELLGRLPRPLAPEDLGILAAARAATGDLATSSELWGELLGRSDLPEHLRHDAQRNKVLTLIAQGRDPEAENEVATLMKQTPPSLSSILIAIAVVENKNDTSRLGELLDLALTTEGPDNLRLRLADCLMRAERWSDAAELYQRLVRPDVDDLYGRRLIQALYRAGRYRSALDACDLAEKEGGPSRGVTEIRSLIFEELGDLFRAKETCRSFLLLQPADASVRLRLANILQRNGELEESKEVLRDVDISQALAGVDSGSLLAQMLTIVGREHDALELMYQLRRRHMTEVDAHLRYFGAHLKLARDKEIPTIAALDVAVELTGTGAPGWILLSSAEDAQLSYKEYPPHHALTTKVLGKVEGDTVSFGSTPTWKIAKIDSKYAFAFRQTLEILPAHFPQNKGIEQHEIPEGDTKRFLENIKDRIQQGEPRRLAVLQQYAEGRCTIGSVGVALGRSPFDAISIVASSPAGLFCSTNAAEEKKESGELLRSEVKLVADLTAIVTLGALDLLKGTDLFGRKIAVAQRTLDELREEFFKWEKTPAEGFMSLSVESGELIRHDTSGDDVKRQRERFGSWLEWLRANAQVLPVPATIAESSSRHGNVGQLIGQSFWDTIRIAAQPGFALLSDDLRLRQLAQATLGVRGTCVALFLLEQAIAGRLERDRYADAIVKLIVSRYRYLATDAKVCEAAARSEQWRPRGALVQILSTISGPEIEVQSATRVAAEFLRLVWLNVATGQQRAPIVLAVLDSLVTGRTVGQVFPPLRAHLAAYMRLLPLAVDELDRIMRAWETMRLT